MEEFGNVIIRKIREDISGKKFGRLEVIRYYGHKQNRHESFWLCKCDCGKETVVNKYFLKKGTTKSCGCFHNEMIRVIGKSLPFGESSFNDLYQSYRISAKRKKLEFNLSKEEFREIIKKNCFYCGIEPKQEWMSSINSNGSYIYNGIDRIDSKIGYIIGNVRPCCSTCNYMKWKLEENVWYEHMKKILKHKSFLII